MESLAIPLAIFLLVAFWGVAETGRKFRTEFKKRGKTWQAVTQLMAGEGTIIVDTLWGPQRGLGHPVIWWSPRVVAQGDDVAADLQSGAFLVKCPRALRSAEALRARFGPNRVVIHTWSIDLALVENARR